MCSCIDVHICVIRDVSFVKMLSVFGRSFNIKLGHVPAVLHNKSEGVKHF